MTNAFHLNKDFFFFWIMEILGNRRTLLYRVRMQILIGNNSTQNADANGNAEISSAAPADANVKFMRIIRGSGYSLHL